MRILLKKSVFVILTPLFLIAGGCKKFLDLTPKGLDIIKTTEQYNGLFNNTNLFSYLNVRNQPGGVTLALGSAEMPFFMGDDVYSIS